MSRGTIDILLTEIGKAFFPVENAISSLDEFQGFMLKMGWSVDSIPPAIADLGSSVAALKSAVGKITDGSSSEADIEEAINALREMINAIDDLDSAAFDASLVADNFAVEFPSQLIYFLLANYLLIHRPAIGFLFRAAGILQTEYKPASGNRPAYTSYSFEWGNITQVLDDPVVVFRNVFNWGEDDLKAYEVLTIMSSLMKAMGVNAYIEEIDDMVAGPVIDTSMEGDPVVYGLNIPLFDNGTRDIHSSAGLVLMELPKKASLKPGFVIIPYANGSIGKDLRINEYLIFNLSTDLNISGGVGLKLRPDSGLELVRGFYDTDTPFTARGSVEMSIVVKKDDAEPIILIGEAGGSRLQMKTLSGKGGIIIDTQEELDLYTEISLDDARLVIGGGEGDGFLQKILPDDGIEAGFDFALGYSIKKGVYFKGSGGLEIHAPVHIQMGPVKIQTITAAIKLSENGLPVELGASVKAELGPLVATVENMGIKATFTFPDRGGNLGPIDMDLGFKPPNGIGLVLDGQGFKGGGYLSFDLANERYSGVLEIEFQSSFSLKAIGLLTTRMPDGSKGFSLLIIITSDFTPIQLGYGFTLNGVGGLLGLNRTMKVDVLRQGVQSGSLNSILFPVDIVANANSIISDLRAVFPPQDDRFVFGPMAKIGWGAPKSLITIELGFIIEVPEPVTVAILGVIRAILPHEEAAIVRIQVNFLGTVEFDKKLVAFDASLYDSRLLTFTLEGDMALRMLYGDNPDFLVTVGGFHPAFTPPPLEIPKIKRLIINLLGGKNPRLTLASYQAITSNTVQFGAAVDLYAKAGKFSVQGFLGFDVLIQFNPFYFIAIIGAMVAVKLGSKTLFSVSLAFTLEGPTPWKAKGTASFKVLFIKIKVKFNKTFGEKKDTSLPEVTIIPEIIAALAHKDNWKGELPPATGLLVTVRNIEGETGGGIIVHPAGTLTVKQKVVPLNINIDKVGSQKPADGNKFTLDVDPAVSAGLARGAYVKEQFAPAQYIQMTDAEKLARKSFEKLDGGITLSGGDNQIQFPYFVKREVDYEEIIIDTNYKRLVTGISKILSFFGKFFLNGTFIARSVVSHHYKTKLKPDKEVVNIFQEGFSIVSADDLTVKAGTVTYESETEAISAMKDLIYADPGIDKDIQVVPNYEVNKL